MYCWLPKKMWDTHIWWRKKQHVIYTLVHIWLSVSMCVCLYVCTYVYKQKGLSCARNKKKQKIQKENRRRPWPFFFNLFFWCFSYCFSVNICVCVYLYVGVVIYVHLFVDLSGCDCNFMRIITPGDVRRCLRKSQTTWQPSHPSSQSVRTAANHPAKGESSTNKHLLIKV